MSEIREAPASTAPARTSGLAIASLALGVIGFFAVPLIASVLAIVFGKQAERDLARDPTLGGEGLARAGVILGWIGVAVAALGLILLVALVPFLF